MINYLFKKVVSLGITLFFVSIVCFFMIKLSPGDKADALLKLQGISLNQDSEGDYYKEYQEMQVKLKLNLPWFYFTIRSSNNPRELPSHWNPSQTKTARILLKNKVKSQFVIDYIESIKQLDEICNEIENRECSRNLRFLYELKDPGAINQWIMKIKELPQVLNNEIASIAIERLGAQAVLLANKAYFYYPIFDFHGFTNQYHNWIVKIIRLDFGVSVSDGLPVAGKVWSALKWTFVITFTAFVLSLGLGIPLGIYSARINGTNKERFLEALMNIFYATPVFWLATLLIVFFTTAEYGSWTNIFPSPSFRIVEDKSIWSLIIRNTKIMVLPVVCLALSALPIIVRLTKRSVLSESIQPYVRALKAKGLEKKAIYRRHIVPNALMPIVTLVSNSFPVALAGSLIVEIIFNIPGMGRLMYTSIFNYDWDVCFAILLLISIITSLVLLLADIIYSRLNPKIRVS